MAERNDATSVPGGLGLPIFAKEAELDEEAAEGEGEHRQNSGRYQNSVRWIGGEGRAQLGQVDDEQNDIQDDDRSRHDERHEVGDPAFRPVEWLGHGDRVREWCARRDSNPWPSAPEADALSS